MFNGSITHRIVKWLAVAAMLGFGLTLAQAEPTLTQVYDTAQAGRLEEAQVMMQQVLVAHPGSAKAHFVQAELSARQGKLTQARESLATAEQLAPGLPFAKPEAVQALRSQLAARSSPPVSRVSPNRSVATGAAPVSAYSPTPAPSSSFPWGIALMLGGAGIALVIFLTRRKPEPSFMPQAAYSNDGAMQGGLNGPQGFGMGNGMPGGAMAPGYGQPAGSGLGGKVMGGLATGLAVGAGVMAAQAIGKSLMGNDDRPARHPDNLANDGYQPLAGNNDMGGQNFGVNDAGSWDDASASSDGGGDWDN